MAELFPGLGREPTVNDFDNVVHEVVERHPDLGSFTELVEEFVEHGLVTPGQAIEYLRGGVYEEENLHLQEPPRL